MVDWSDNPELVRAHIMRDIPDLEAFAYYEELVDPNTGKPRASTLEERMKRATIEATREAYANGCFPPEVRLSDLENDIQSITEPFE